MLLLFFTLQDLPEDVKAQHEHAASQHNVGWSHGKEALRSGLKDTHKGSFYANPMQVCAGLGSSSSSRARSMANALA